ncbi:Uu.00g102690.m01.CDS01 [Anthostomella pinea]|uniref:Putative transcription factor kapC n=1 Tax=Anthostomella pinea TaxID=933095 RepID=A0AAI8YD46_9PEZI|nr:Uu.00g102690.m01.CDS01 [Anthostomella pinea]
MDEITVIVDLPSPSNPSFCVYGDTELYFDSTSTSSSTSPMASPYDLAFSGVYASPEYTDGSGDANQTESQQTASKPATKRKRENRYKNAPPSVLSRRRAQNRASQRAYRERKDQRIKDLETLLSEADQKNDVLNQAYASLQAEYVKLKSDQGAAPQYPPPGLAYDPTIGAAAGEMELYLYDDPTAGYTM